MKVDVLLGLQWGDEGKGKVVDDVAIEQLTVQGGILAVHPLCGAVAGAIGGGDRLYLG